MAELRTPSPNGRNGIIINKKRSYGQPDTASPPTWAGAQERSAKVNGYGNQKESFLGKHFRSLSTSLPRFAVGDKDFSEKEKLGRGRNEEWSDGLKNVVGVVLRQGWKLRLVLAVLATVVLLVSLFTLTREY